MKAGLLNKSIVDAACEKEQELVLVAYQPVSKQMKQLNRNRIGKAEISKTQTDLKHRVETNIKLK